ncbi:beta-lactamase domain protein [Shewanella halifaxensis HAW-EB4]|uniref:Beta-lactamase domain protein n=1 Tax=Shewanella halifaxensis (strain HAW-EB4) TaxID=458817 RepID=B0TLN1_SHEHH|nr:MBL fold metallo-hydrolase [Shewanella halifaxensis]ABZ75981.1 beta-lactamase domain protein [Shewanella halifaxensis HAW-EB4]
MVEVYCVDAAHGDCILVVSNGVRILIDSGPKELKIRRQVKGTLGKLLPDKTVDLAIVTHNDDDHIGGFKTLISENTIIVKKILFNSVVSLNKILGKKTTKISYRQDKELSGFVKTTDIELISKHYDPKVDSNITVGELTVRIISPNYNALLDLGKWKEKEEAKLSRHKISGKEKNELSIMEYLKTFNTYRFESDMSPTNRSSLAVIIEGDGFKGLFLGDSHSKDIEEYFSTREPDECLFDVVKISHHGSRKNTSNELLKTVISKEFIICADKSSRHAHPDSLMMARLIGIKKSPVIHFSTDSDKLRMMLSEITDEATFTFPSEGVNRIVYV